MVLQLGLQPDYVLDKMTPFEQDALMEFSYYKDKTTWEQTRLIRHSVLQPNCRKSLKLDDIQSFPWDNVVDDVVIDDNAVNRLKSMSKSMEEKLNNK